MLSSSSFMVSCLLFNPQSHVEFIFVYGVRVWFDFMDLHEAVQLPEKSGEITRERTKRRSQTENNAQVWMWLVMEVKSDAKNSIA